MKREVKNYLNYDEYICRIHFSMMESLYALKKLKLTSLSKY